MKYLAGYIFAFSVLSLAAALPAWDFRPGGNGKEWKTPEKSEVRWLNDGLYIQGTISGGIEIDIPGGLDADKCAYLNFSMNSAEYCSSYLYFAREGEDFSNDRRIRIIHKGFNIKHEGKVDCRSNKFWKGKINRLRFTPVGREQDNALISYLYFSDGAGTIAANGSFETADIKNQSLPDAWEINGKAEIVTSAYAGDKALSLSEKSSASQKFELIHEYDIEITLAYKTAAAAALTLTHYDIFDKKLSDISFTLPAGGSWQQFHRQHTPPAGTAYIKAALYGAAGNTICDAFNVKEIVPASETFRWWDQSDWIWCRKAMNSFGKPVYFRKKFNVADPGRLNKMMIQLSTRNLGGPIPCDKQVLYVNGKAVQPAYDTSAGTMTVVYNILPYLRSGTNILAVQITNLMSPGALNADILIENKGNMKNRFQRFGSRTNWKSSERFEENWMQLTFDDSKWQNSAIRGQATPGSFCRLPYRFFGTAGTLALNNIVFPKKISVTGKYDFSADMILAADKGFKEVTDGAVLHFQLITPDNNVAVKFKKLRITEDMLARGKVKISFPFCPEFLRSGTHKFRIYADRLAFEKAPEGFTLNRDGNYIETEVSVSGSKNLRFSKTEIDRHDSVPRIVINGKGYPVHRFEHGAHTQFVTEESLDIAERVHSRHTPILDIQLGRSAWFYNADGTCNFDAYDTFIMSYLSRHPESYILVHWALDTAGTRGSMREWLLQNPSEWAKDHNMNEQSGTYLGTNVVASMASKPWQNVIADVTSQLVRHISKSPYADRVIGIMPSCGISSEWLHWGSQARGFMDYSEPFQNGFREFLKRRYKALAALNRAWKKDFADWKDVKLPSKDERMIRKYHDFLNYEENKAVIDMREFLNLTVSDAILKVLRAVKSASEGNMLAGVYYGYSMYVSGPYFGPFSGHHALGRILDSPDLDFLYSPCRYDDRSSGGASGAMMPIASMRKHKILYTDEADNRLVHSWNTSGKTYTLRESKAVIEREFAFTFATASGLGWLDFGEGWLPYDSRLCKVFDNCLRISRELTEENAILQDDENAIAVVLDEKAIYHTAYDQHLFLNLVGIYPHLFRTGAAIHWYLLDELDKLEPYKCIIFTPTVTSFSPQQENFINRKLKKDKRTLVFLYSAGGYRGRKFAPANTGIIPGMKMAYKEHFAKRVLRRANSNDPILKNIPEHYTFGFAEPTDFYIYPADKNGKVLFTLNNTSLPGIVKKEYPDWTAIYSSSGGLSSQLLRNIAEYSGIRIFNPYQGDVTYSAKGFYAVHTLAGGKRVFHVPANIKKAVELISGKEYTVSGGKFEFDLQPQSTVMFRVY